MSDMTPTEDLREQVARLLHENFNAARGRNGVDPLLLADTLLPLFAARDRAVAEKGWAEGVAAGLREANLMVRGICDMPVNPYTVRTQLEGDGA